MNVTGRGDQASGAPADALQDARHHWTEKADDWITWSDPMAAMAERFNRPFLEETGVRTGDTVLDLASGVGEPALTATTFAGPEGFVIATDFVPEMLAGIRRRNTAPNLHLAAADMTALPFADQSVDRITCRFGIMFVPDPLTAGRECWRVLKPGGRVGFMIWGARSEQALFSVLADATADFLKLTHDSHHHAIFRFGEEDSLPRLLRDTDLIDIREISLRFNPKIQADRPFWRAQLEMSFGHLLRDLDTVRRRELDELIRERFAPYALPDGLHYQLPAHIKIVTADKKPS